RAPETSVAATEITPAQLAGADCAASTAWLPAATTTGIPRFTASLIADCSTAGHSPGTPRLRLMTVAGFGLAAAPATGAPAAHRTPAATSVMYPWLQAPTARTGRILASGATPATPSPLFASAAAMP